MTLTASAVIYAAEIMRALTRVDLEHGEEANEILVEASLFSGPSPIGKITYDAGLETYVLYPVTQIN